MKVLVPTSLFFLKKHNPSELEWEIKIWLVYYLEVKSTNLSLVQKL